MADVGLIAELQKSPRNESYDEILMPELSSEDIDFRVASELFSDIRTIRRDDLRKLQIITRYQNKWAPTIGGVLLFSPDREQYFPDAWIQ